MIAFDTNILIYVCDFCDPRRQAIAWNLIRSESGGVLLWQGACEFIAASRKLTSQGFTPEQAWNRLDEFLDLFFLAVPMEGSLVHARELQLQSGWSHWDAMLVAAAVEAGATRLYSEDLPGTNRSPIEVVNPFS